MTAAAKFSVWVKRRLGAGLCVLLAFTGLAGFAGSAQSASADPPTRAGRVAEVIGEAWIFDAEARTWARVTRNQTIAEGDRLRTDERARLSLRVGSSSLWLDERSDLEITHLDEGRVLLLLAKGDLGLRLRSQEAVSEYKVQTREGLFFAEREGLYRLAQMDRGSRADAMQGRLRFESERGGNVPPVWLDSGEQIEVWWANGPRVERQRLQADSFSDWLLAQGRAEGDAVAAISQRYVSPEMTGVEDLDRHGRWEQAPDYGNVWIPSAVAMDWAPYRHGRWVWTRHWGWSWVDDAPWGFAPFHYGRWVYWGNRWCWSPGRYVVRPVYAPALVAWVGGPVVSVGVTIGGGRPPPPRYGWYPLAPREVYVPSYRHGPAYGERLNHERDPVTVQRPRSNRDVVGAISYLPSQGGAVRPMPVSEAIPVRPLPVAPGRQDLPVVQPQRPVAPVTQQPGENLPWRSDNVGRRERERELARDREPGLALPNRGSNTAPANAAVVPVNPPAVSAGELPWRGSRDQAREPMRESAREPSREPVREHSPEPGFNRPGWGAQQSPAQLPQRAPERSQERAPERVQERMPDRGPERLPERTPERTREWAPERQIERQPERTRAAELPQRPQMAPQAPAPARVENSGVPRRAERGEGEPRRGEADKR
ncbi:DUF6600 domain-containing protein [Roseateles sp. PN1]|uniref:DUF6600 domain-containing protein n=1 Tax=Roseateles sp. PN1 TaxID=3137372 RepID=UPI003139E179